MSTDMLHYASRSRDLLKPHALPWLWSEFDDAEHARKPKFVRLVDGRWMQVTQVEGDIVGGRIMAYESFVLMMSNQARGRGRVLIELNTALVVMALTGLLAFHGHAQMLFGNSLVGMMEVVLGGFAFMPALSLALQKALMLRRFTVLSPGPNITVRTVDNVRTQTPYGGPPHVDAATARGALGGAPGKAPMPWNAGGINGRGLGN